MRGLFRALGFREYTRFRVWSVGFGVWGLGFGVGIAAPVERVRWRKKGFGLRAGTGSVCDL